MKLFMVIIRKSLNQQIWNTTKKRKYFFSSLFVNSGKGARSSAKAMQQLSVVKKLSYPRKREVTTTIYFNPIQPNKKSSKNFLPSFHSIHFVTTAMIITCCPVLLWTVFNSFCDSPRQCFAVLLQPSLLFFFLLFFIVFYINCCVCFFPI